MGRRRKTRLFPRSGSKYRCHHYRSFRSSRATTPTRSPAISIVSKVIHTPIVRYTNEQNSHVHFGRIKSDLWWKQHRWQVLHAPSSSIARRGAPPAGLHGWDRAGSPEPRRAARVRVPGMHPLGVFRTVGLTMHYALLLVRLMEELEISEWCYGA